MRTTKVYDCTGKSTLRWKRLLERKPAPPTAPPIPKPGFVERWQDLWFYGVLAFIVLACVVFAVYVYG